MNLVGLKVEIPKSAKSDLEMIWGHEAAKILGVSLTTFRRNHKAGRYPEIGYVDKQKGRKYSKLDVFRTAFPSASRGELYRLMLEYNQKRGRRHAKAKVGQKKK